MKKFKTLITVLSAIVLFVTSCSKKETFEQIQKPEEVTFNSTQQEIRDITYENHEKTNAALAKRKSLKERMENATPENPFIIYVSKKGETVTNANWNNGNTFTVTMADTSLINQALETVRKMYSMFNNVLVTCDDALWLVAGPENRVKVIVGNCNVLGPYLGYAWINCYLWQDDTPSFVLVNNCNPLALITDIGYGIAHEVAHMFGREHQYASGGTGFKSWANLLGNWANKNFVTWSNADITAFKEIFGITDDYLNSLNGWTNNTANVNKPFNGSITFDDPADICRMKGSANGQTNITLSSGQGWPLVFNIYNKNKALKYTGNTLQSLSKSFTIPKGNDYWYIEVVKYSGGVFPSGYGSTTFTSTGFTQQ